MSTIDTTTHELVSVNPATNEPVGTLERTPVDTISGIVARSSKAQQEWARLPIEERAGVLAPAGERLMEEAERIGTLLTREMGKPLAEGIGEVTYAAKNWMQEIDEIVAALQP